MYLTLTCQAPLASTRAECNMDTEGIREVDSPGAQDGGITLHSQIKGESVPEMVYKPIMKDSRAYKPSFAPIEETHRCSSCE